MKDKAKDNVIFRRSWWQCMKNLPSDARLALYDTICKYAFDGVVPEFDTMSAVSVSFSFIKQDIDSAKEKYQSICEKRAEAGKKHSGNQYTNGTNGTSVPKMEQNGTEYDKNNVACSFQTIAFEQIFNKLTRALTQYNVKQVVLGGGVSANSYLRREIVKRVKKFNDNIDVVIPFVNGER